MNEIEYERHQRKAVEIAARKLSRELITRCKRLQRERDVARQSSITLNMECQTVIAMIRTLKQDHKRLSSRMGQIADNAYTILHPHETGSYIPTEMEYLLETYVGEYYPPKPASSTTSTTTSSSPPRNKSTKKTAASNKDKDKTDGEHEPRSISTSSRRIDRHLRHTRSCSPQLVRSMTTLVLTSSSSSSTTNPTHPTSPPLIAEDSSFLLRRSISLPSFSHIYNTPDSDGGGMNGGGIKGPVHTYPNMTMMTQKYPISSTTTHHLLPTGLNQLPTKPSKSSWSTFLRRKTKEKKPLLDTIEPSTDQVPEITIHDPMPDGLELLELLPPNTYEVVFTEEKLGIKLAKVEENITVKASSLPDLPKVGDILLCINGHSIEGMTLRQVVDVLATIDRPLTIQFAMKIDEKQQGHHPPSDHIVPVVAMY